MTIRARNYSLARVLLEGAFGACGRGAVVFRARARAEEVEARRRDRERLFASLPPGVKATYQRIAARIRDGVALAEARNGSCSACFIALRPQVMAEVRRGEEIVTCDNCNRILYYQPSAHGTTVSAT